MINSAEMGFVLRIGNVRLINFAGKGYVLMVSVQPMLIVQRARGVSTAVACLWMSMIAAPMDVRLVKSAMVNCVVALSP